MGVIATVAGIVASAIGAAAAAIAAVVTSVISAVTAAVSTVAAAIASGVSAAVSAISAGISAVAAKVSAVCSSVVGSIGSTLSSWAGSIASYAESIYSGMQAIAEVIHLKTLMTIHKIAYLVSDDYREMINKIYRKFAKVSDALGLGAQFINLALHNARSTILDVSAMMGKSYDIAQITWLKSLASFTKKFESKADLYENNPEMVFEDVSQWLIKDSVNAGSGVQRTVISSLTSVTETVEETVNRIVTIRNDLDKFVSELPLEIREEIEPYINPLIRKVDGFILDEYRPYKQKMDAIIDVLDNNQTTVRNRVDGIVDRLTRPGDVLANVDKLPIGKRIEQENKISEVAARSDQRQADNLEAQAAPTWEHLQKLRKALEEAPPPPEYRVVERRKPVMPAGQQAKEADTWFVGDY